MEDLHSYSRAILVGLCAELAVFPVRPYVGPHSGLTKDGAVAGSPRCAAVCEAANCPVGLMCANCSSESPLGRTEEYCIRTAIYRAGTGNCKVPPHSSWPCTKAKKGSIGGHHFPAPVTLFTVFAPEWIDGTLLFPQKPAGCDGIE